MGIQQPSKSLDTLLSETSFAVRERESQTFERLSHGRPLVLFGAGGLGKRTAAGLRRHGITPLAFCDNNPALQGEYLNGIPVLSPQVAASRYGADAAFVVTIWGAQAQDRMAHRLSFLRGLSCQTVMHWGSLYWKYAADLLPYYAANQPHLVLEQAEQVRACAELWADDFSRREYFAQVKWRLHADFDVLADPVHGPAYFRPELWRISPQEVFVDCGAFDGDTVQAFLAQAERGFERIVAFEPDPANFARLATNAAKCANIELAQAAVGSETATVRFSASGDPSSSTGSGDSEVRCVALDDYFDDRRVTSIKMDIEGFEPQALAGARQIIQRHRPVLCICVYHAQEHLWQIPLQIKSYCSDYSFYLRPHGPEVWDLVCYAIPK